MMYDPLYGMTTLNGIPKTHSAFRMFEEFDTIINEYLPEPDLAKTLFRFIHAMTTYLYFF